MNDLLSLDDASLVREFRLVALANIQSIYVDFNTDASIASGLRLEAICTELNSRGKDSVVLLKTLLDDPDDNVKSYAVIFVINFDREAALATLREVKQAGGFAGFAASIRLDEYEKRR